MPRITPDDDRMLFYIALRKAKGVDIVIDGLELVGSCEQAGIMGQENPTVPDIAAAVRDVATIEAEEGATAPLISEIPDLTLYSIGLKVLDRISELGNEHGRQPTSLPPMASHPKSPASAGAR